MTAHPFEVLSVNVSDAKGTIKHPVAEIEIDSNGIVGDAHAGFGHRQVSLLAKESIDRFAHEAERCFSPGEFAENLTTGGVPFESVALLDRFVIGDVELEVTQIGKACHGDRCAIYREVGRCVMPKEGIFTRVLRPGRVRKRDSGVHIQRPLKISVVTVSDRASRGVYEDKSGPAAVAFLQEHLSSRKWRPEFRSAVVPDERKDLDFAIHESLNTGADILITTGGTGVGPRDITPEVVSERISKQIPGVMEGVRAKFGASNPNALLSRAVAGTVGECLVYTLPGSVRGVTEYLEEISKSLEHALFMMRGIDTHVG